MKQTVFTFMAFAVVALTASCNKNDQPVDSSVSRSLYKDGAPNRMDDNAAIWYCPDCSKINALNHSEGIPGISMKNYSYVFHGNTIVNAEGKVAYDNLRFNDKGYIVYLEDFTQPNSDIGITHTSYDVEYNSGDRIDSRFPPMSWFTYSDIKK